MSERVVSVVILVTVGLGLSLAIAPPLVWAFVAVLIAAACVGTDRVLRVHPNARSTEWGISLYVLPSMVVLASALFLRLPVVGGGVGAIAGLVVAAGVFGVTIYGEYQTFDRSSWRYRQARLVLNLIAYVTAFALFSAIFAPKVRSILSATAIVVASAFITAELLRGAGRPDLHATWVAVVALALGQVTWALN